MKNSPYIVSPFAFFHFTILFRRPQDMIVIFLYFFAISRKYTLTFRRICGILIERRRATQPYKARTPAHEPYAEVPKRLKGLPC